MIYFTIQTNQFYQNKNDFLSLLNDPINYRYKNNWNIENKTFRIETKYAQNYWEKHKPNIMLPPIPCLKDDIKNHYYSFKIPKKTNPKKFREIDAPDPILKNYQTYLKNTIEFILHTLPHNAAHAYVQNRSIKTALEIHQKNKSKWFLKLDLKDFFPSHNKEYITKTLKQIYPFAFMFDDDKYKEFINNMIDYALLNNKLPQGTPLSPTLTNILMVPIDYQISKEINNIDNTYYVYTRYADDLLISSKYKFDYKLITNIIHNIFIKNNTPFKINTEKTRFGSSSGKNWNLGLMLNKDNKITIGHKNNQKMRAMLNSFCHNYATYSVEEKQHIQGLLAYYKSIEPDYIKYCIDKYNKKFNINIEYQLKK